MTTKFDEEEYKRQVEEYIQRRLKTVGTVEYGQLIHSVLIPGGSYLLQECEKCHTFHIEFGSCPACGWNGHFYYPFGGENVVCECGGEAFAIQCIAYGVSAKCVNPKCNKDIGTVYEG